MPHAVAIVRIQAWLAHLRLWAPGFRGFFLGHGFGLARNSYSALRLGVSLSTRSADDVDEPEPIICARRPPMRELFGLNAGNWKKPGRFLGVMPELPAYEGR
jgi:hypothetical protein